MEAALAATLSGGGPGGLLPALQALVQARTVAPDAKLQALSLRQGTIEMKIAAKDATSLDHMTQSLRSSGWPQVEASEQGTITLPWRLGGQADFFLLFVVAAGAAAVLILVLAPLLDRLAGDRA